MGAMAEAFLRTIDGDELAMPHTLPDKYRGTPVGTGTGRPNSMRSLSTLAYLPRPTLYPPAQAICRRPNFVKNGKMLFISFYNRSREYDLDSTKHFAGKMLYSVERNAWKWQKQ